MKKLQLITSLTSVTVTVTIICYIRRKTIFSIFFKFIVDRLYDNFNIITHEFFAQLRRLKYRWKTEGTCLHEKCILVAINGAKLTRVQIALKVTAKFTQ